MRTVRIIGMIPGARRKPGCWKNHLPSWNCSRWRTSLNGPERQFAATQRYVRSWEQTGLFADIVETALLTQFRHRNWTRNSVASAHGQAPCLTESCPKNGDVPKSPLLTIGSLVPSAGTNHSQESMLLRIAGAVGNRILPIARKRRKRTP